MKKKRELTKQVSPQTDVTEWHPEKERRITTTESAIQRRITEALPKPNPYDELETAKRNLRMARQNRLDHERMLKSAEDSVAIAQRELEDKTQALQRHIDEAARTV